MEHVSNEYTLTETSATSWLLSPLQVQRFKHTNKILQPGEPVVSKWEFENKNDRQPVQFILKANDRISDISLEIANYSTVRLDCVLEEGQYLKYAGGDSFLIYDRNWNEIKRFSVKTDQMNIPKGKVSFVNVIGAKNPWGAVYQEKDLLWPISDNEMQRNPSLEQNPGFE